MNEFTLEFNWHVFRSDNATFYNPLGGTVIVTEFVSKTPIILFDHDDFNTRYGAFPSGWQVISSNLPDDLFDQKITWRLKTTSLAHFNKLVKLLASVLQHNLSYQHAISTNLQEAIEFYGNN